MESIPEAQTPNDSADDDGDAPSLADMPPLVIGPPFAIAYGIDMMDRSEHEPGTGAIVKCQGPDERGCGQLFRMNLLDGTLKACPRCGQAYTHMLLVAPVDDDEVIRDAMVQVLAANGFQLNEGPGEPPDDMPGGDDEGEG